MGGGNSSALRARHGEEKLLISSPVSHFIPSASFLRLHLQGTKLGIKASREGRLIQTACFITLLRLSLSASPRSRVLLLRRGDDLEKKREIRENKEQVE